MRSRLSCVLCVPCRSHTLKPSKAPGFAQLSSRGWFWTCFAELILLTDALLQVGRAREGEVDGGVCCCAHWNSNLERGDGDTWLGRPQLSQGVLAKHTSHCHGKMRDWLLAFPTALTQALTSLEPLNQALTHNQDKIPGQPWPWAPRVPPVTQALPIQAPWPGGPTI